MANNLSHSGCVERRQSFNDRARLLVEVPFGIELKQSVAAKQHKPELGTQFTRLHPVRENEARQLFFRKTRLAGKKTDVLLLFGFVQLFNRQLAEQRLQRALYLFEKRNGRQGFTRNGEIYFSTQRCIEQDRRGCKYGAFFRKHLHHQVRSACFERLSLIGRVTNAIETLRVRLRLAKLLFATQIAIESSDSETTCRKSVGHTDHAVHFRHLHRKTYRRLAGRKIAFDDDVRGLFGVPNNRVFGAPYETPIGEHFEKQIGFATDKKLFDV